MFNSNNNNFSDLIVNVENKFTEVYNYNIDSDHKTYENIKHLAYTLLFEEARVSNLSPYEFADMLSKIKPVSPIARYVLPDNDTKDGWNKYKKIYNKYINNRVENYRPIISTLVAIGETKYNITENEIQQLDEHYSLNPIYGESV